ncbi:MAG: hypothetical protein IJE16_06700 [Ruminococcus sp.]|nr:hypothetical protein [Ruminococcus sp.]
MNEYKNMLRKISASENFKKSTLELLSSQTDKRKPVLKFAPVMAACLCVIIVLTIFIIPFGNSNNFTITANAETTLSDTDFTPISDLTAAQSGFFGLDFSEVAPMLDSGEKTTDNPKISTNVFFSLNVEGESIESVKFEISNGFFEVGEGVTYKLLTLQNEIKEKTVGMQDSFKYFESITLDYNNQIVPIGKYYEGDWVAMSVLRPYDEEAHRELIENLTSLSAFKPDPQKELESEDYFETTIENFLNEMYKDTEIYVTCTFENGKQLTKTLEVYVDCEITGTKEEYFFTGDNYAVDEKTEEDYEKYEVYDYTVKLCAKIV